MAKRSMFVGRDVHKESIDVSLAEEGRDGEVRHYGVIRGDLEAVAKVLRALRAPNRRLRFVYEAGPCGFGIHRYLTAQGEDCVVVNPSSMPKRSGDRIKTDRRDGDALARLHRAGELTFRYAEHARHCHPGIAAAITGPRLYALETLPSGPAWADVDAIIKGLATDRAVDIRRVAALLLFATYGFRVGEVAGLTLDDLDWEHELIRIRRVKRHDVQTYPLSQEAGVALLRYITEVRPRGRWREVFLTLKAPHRPISGGGLYHLASRVLCARGVQLRHHGPHALRHACATRLLSEGLSFKDIGDHLGHRSADATAVYAKVDVPSLREVARFDLGGVL